jgi:hypothetical protein
METAVLMRRKLFDGEVKQNSKDNTINANDLVMVGNKWRILNSLKPLTLQTWLNTQSTQEFIEELKKTFDCVIKTKRGANGGTWLHPYLAIDLALHISPKFKVEVYGWLYDELLKYRNFSGDSYKKMAGALWDRTSSKSTFPKDIAKLARHIQNECAVKDWQTATEQQLRLRDRIHENIALLCEVMNNLNQAVRLGILKAKESNIGG